MEKINYSVLIARQLAGELTAEQQQQLDAWIRADVRNAHLAETYRQLWKGSWNKGLDVRIDSARKQRVYNTLMARVRAGREAHKIIPRHSLIRGIAAVFVFALAIVSVQLFRPVTINASHRQNVWLMDSSRIVLERNAVLSISRSVKTFDASLEGQAYVELSGQRRAFIRCEEFSVEATQASFTLRANGSRHPGIAVLSGVVEVVYHGVRKTLHSGQHFIPVPRPNK